MISDTMDSSPEPCIEAVDFDSRAFGVPWFRVKRFDAARLAAEMSRLGARSQIVVDAKLPSHELGNSQLLQSLGFRKVCMQIVLTRDLLEGAEPPLPVALTDRMELPETLLWEHARNFHYDRFNLDPLLPKEGIHRLFFEWTRNSLTTGSKHVAHIGSNFCTFSNDRDLFMIDLLSVLDQRKGIGQALVNSVVRIGSLQGGRRLQVTTECENTPAWRLYTRSGFTLQAFQSVFHFVRI